MSFHDNRDRRRSRSDSRNRRDNDRGFTYRDSYRGTGAGQDRNRSRSRDRDRDRERGRDRNRDRGRDSHRYRGGSVSYRPSGGRGRVGITQGDSVSSGGELAVLKQKLSALEIEIRSLREQNRLLRKQLADKQSGPKPQQLPLPSPVEFDYDLSNWNVSQFHDTGQLHAVLEAYGTFPDRVFVREEMQVVWKLVQDGIANREVYIIEGSPGVGKSLLIVLMSLYLAMAVKRNVILVRQLNPNSIDEGGPLAVLCLRSDGRHKGYPKVLQFGDVKAIYDTSFEPAENSAVLIVLDGWNQKELDILSIQWPRFSRMFHLLATSAQYNPKNSDPHIPVLLPAWRESDMKLYADSLSDEEFKDRYLYSGGNLHEFEQKVGLVPQLMDRGAVSSDIATTTTTTMSSAMVTAIISLCGAQRGEGIDRLQRTCVVDPSNPRHYTSKFEQGRVVDAPFARHALSKIPLPPLQVLKTSMDAAKLVNTTAWQGWIFDDEIVMASIMVHRGVIRMRQFLSAQDDTSSDLQSEQDHEVVIRLSEINTFKKFGASSTPLCIQLLVDNAAPGLYWCPLNRQYDLGVDAVLFLASTKTVLYIQKLVVGDPLSYNHPHRLVRDIHDSLVESVPFMKGGEDGGSDAPWSYAYLTLLPSLELVKYFVRHNAQKGAVVTKIDELEQGKAYVGYIAEEEDVTLQPLSPPSCGGRK